MDSQNTHSSSCGDVLPRLQTFFDGELDSPDIAQEVEAHLERCEACQRELKVLRALREGMLSAQRPAAPPYLHRRLKKAARDAVKQSGVRRWPAGFYSRHPRLMLTVAATLLLVTVGGLLTVPGLLENYQRQQESGLELRAFVNYHVYGSFDVYAGEIKSSDPREIEQWFAGKLPFQPVLPEWERLQPSVGQICSVRGLQVCVVKYPVEDEVMTLYIRPVSQVKIDWRQMLMESEVVGVLVEGDQRVKIWEKDGQNYMAVLSSSLSKLLKYLK